MLGVFTLLSQFVLLIIFFLVLWCEISNKFKDCFINVSFRLFLMLSTLILIVQIESLPNFTSFILLPFLIICMLYIVKLMSDEIKLLKIIRF